MSYKLRFHEQALKEWKKLGTTLQEQFKKKLAERLEQPRIPSAALSGMSDCYKIKLKAAGYRLVYRVEDDIMYVTVIAVGKRERSIVYRNWPPSFRRSSMPDRSSRGRQQGRLSTGYPMTYGKMRKAGRTL